jgi:hypothetical protein
MVARAYNLSYVGGKDGRIMVQGNLGKGHDHSANAGKTFMIKAAKKLSMEGSYTKILKAM